MFQHMIRKKVPKAVLYAVMFGLSFIFLFPFLYMLVTSLKTSEDLNNFTVVWIPKHLKFSNYPMAAGIIRYFQNLRNTTIVTVLAAGGQLITCSMAGYGLARYRFFGRRIVFFIMVLAMLVPVQTFIVPQYLVYGSLGWLNSFLPLIIPSWFAFGFKGALFIFIFRQFYLGLPKELEEAARVDGCGFIRTFTHIVFPVARSAYLVVLVLALVWHWSNTFEPSMYISKTDLNMVATGLSNMAAILKLPPEVMESTYGVTDENALNNAVLMAGTFMVVLPILVIFSFLQKQFIQGIERAGLTGE